MFTQKSICRALVHVLVALLFAHLVVNLIQETWLPSFTARYFTALLYSMVPAYLLIEYILLVSRIVNKVFKEHNLRAKRVKYQFVFGVCLASINTLLFMVILAWIKDQELFGDSNSMLQLASFLVYILMVNVFYFVYHEYRKLPKLEGELREEAPTSIKVSNSAVFESNLPAIIYYEDKACFAVDFNGVKTIWPNTIAESMGFLDSANYFQLNRKDIIHRAAILSFSTYQFRFIKIIHNLPIGKDLITSRRKTLPFREWASL